MIEIHKILYKIGCCSSCILRYVGSKNASFYENSRSSIENLGLSKETDCRTAGDNCQEVSEGPTEYIGPTIKRRRVDPCICCLGLLQEEGWEDVFQRIQTAVQDSRYESETFACALTYPISILLREHSINLYLMEELPRWKPDGVTSLKEAWKWSFGVRLAQVLKKKLDSGAVCHFLIKANMSYSEENQELETLRMMCPSVFAERERSHRKFHGEMFTKKGVEGVLSDVDAATFKQHFRCPPEAPPSWVECTSVDCSHCPIYLAGRYCKYSRELSQTPWILNGRRMMESSVQDIVFGPILQLYRIPVGETNSRLKFISSGREDVDVRCLGGGRPFVVEISEPKGVHLDCQTLKRLSEEMSEDKTKIHVRDLQVVTKDELTILKMGEETKTKTYVALCIKLGDITNNSSVENSHTCDHNIVGSDIVTAQDIIKLNSYTNSENGDIVIKQKTPLRVLHRRPLLVRDRTIHHMGASLIQDKPHLFTVELTTQAGTYIKEFVHGDFGRTKPSLSEILCCKVDILALDVKSINLDWPKKID